MESVAYTVAPAMCTASATAMAPLPVPTSHMEMGPLPRRLPAYSITASTSISVSGRGTSTLGSTWKSSP